ncbi:hypothetical protein ACF1AB_25135 [Streptomyces sp. NPDC014846]|uniref:hypothetical protein n=1 Tax=unclassified Streptomyces TaxID=2593676 RepID=UPI003701FC87
MSGWHFADPPRLRTGAVALPARALTHGAGRTAVPVPPAIAAAAPTGPDGLRGRISRQSTGADA